MLKHENEKIQRGWDAALEVLKPSKKDLEHGLELHADALVCESYGFAPVAALDVDELRALIESGASAAEVQARRQDMHMTRKVTDPTERREFMEAWDASGVTCILQNAGPPAALARLKRCQSMPSMGLNPSDCSLATVIIRAKYHGLNLRNALMSTPISRTASRARA